MKDYQIMRIVKSIGKFFFFTTIFYLVLLIIWGEYAPYFFQKNLSYQRFSTGFLHTRLQEVSKTSDVDLLILGSSRAYRHYDTRKFEKAGFKSFNLGSSGQTFLQTEWLVEQYIEELDPEIVLLDIYPGMFSSDGVESSLDFISNKNNKWKAFKLVLKHSNIKVWNTWFYSVYKKFFSSTEQEVEPLIRGEDKYIRGGYVERDTYLTQTVKEEEVDYNLNPDQVEAFHNIINRVHSTKAKLILLHSPLHRQVQYEHQKIDSLAKLFSVEYHDLSYPSFINDRFHFFDAMHMNEAGVEVFNTHVIEKVLP